MINVLWEDEDGNAVHELDAEGIDYLIRGLEELCGSVPGTELSTPSVSEDESGVVGMGSMILLRAADP